MAPSGDTQGIGPDTLRAANNARFSDLTDADLRKLQEGFISRDIALRARLRRVNDLEGSEIVGRKQNAGANYAGIVFPYFVPGNYASPREYRVRRDQPDYERNGDGDLKEKGKYLSPPGRANMLYFPPGLSEADLADTSLPCVITEGEKKTLALLRLANEKRDRKRFVPSGISGVWNWKGTVGKTANASGSRVDVKGVIPDFGLFNWRGRIVCILFDANVRTNENVWNARQGLARELERRGANVLFAELPHDCGVNGIDDFLGRIERESGTEAAIAAGLKLLGTAIPFGNAQPTFADDPRPLDLTLRPVSSIDPDCLPPVLRKWLVSAAKVIGCPLDFLVLAAIVSAGSLVGSRVRIKPLENSNWFVVPNLYAGIVGPPSTKKTPALDEARKPILKLQAAARESYATAKENYEIEARYFEKDDKEARHKSKSPEEYKTKLALISKPEKPTLKRYETNDATSQKIIQFLAENPNGLLLIRDELTGWLRSLDAEYDQSARSLYLELWKGAITYDHARVSENREILLTSGTVSIVGGIQPSRLQHYISEAYSVGNADGFPQRFLYTYPDARRPAQKPTPNDFEKLEQGLEAARGTFKDLAEKDFGGKTVGDSGDRFLSVTFDHEAQAAFYEWKDAIEAEAMRLETGDEVFASFLLKQPKNCAAIALIFHCLEQSGSKKLPDRISIATTNRSLAYMAVTVSHARRVFALGENLIFSLAQRVLGKIKTGKLTNGFTVREVKRKGWSGLNTSELIQDVLTLLEDYGYVKPIDSKAGRGTVRYYIHPAVEIQVDDDVRE